jgi:hypothetical protein
MSPFVMVILLNGYGFTVDFYSFQACDDMARKLEISASNVKCGTRGEPVKVEISQAVEPSAAPRKRTIRRKPVVRRVYHEFEGRGEE